MGGKEGAFIFTQIKSDWFLVDLTKENSWVLNFAFLDKNEIEIILDGTSVFGIGETNLTLTVYDAKFKQTRKTYSRCCIEADGVQVAKLSIKGKLELHPADHRIMKAIQ